MLGKPLSEVSERLLHNEFASRGSARDKLSRLLSAIDHRDGESAANLCSNDCIWDTNTNGFGAVCGKEDIKLLIDERLTRLSHKCGEEWPRHRLAPPVEGTDVITPDGSKVHFNISLDSTGHVKKLARIPR